MNNIIKIKFERPSFEPIEVKMKENAIIEKITLTSLIITPTDRLQSSKYHFSSSSFSSTSEKS